MVWSLGQGPGAIFNFGWSLSTEEQFYVFWPFIVKFFRGRWAVITMIAVIAVRVTAQFGGLNRILPSDSMAHHIVMSIAVPICAGALLSHALSWQRGFETLYRIIGHKLSAPVALILLLISVIWVDTNGVVFCWIMLPLFIGACVIREDNGLAKILRCRPLAFIGVISYGMYLYNTLVVKAVRPLLAHAGLRHPLAVYPFTVGLTILVAWLSYRYFESPFLKLKEKFSRLHPAPSTAAPVAVVSAETHEPVHP
jgi:peptidoglycan/LPS O-acetylase OafA/YrhL